MPGAFMAMWQSMNTSANRPGAAGWVFSCELLPRGGRYAALAAVGESCVDGGAQIIGQHLMLLKHRQAFPRERGYVRIA
jgi:hypothetical protein